MRCSLDGHVQDAMYHAMRMYLGCVVCLTVLGDEEAMLRCRWWTWSSWSS